LQVIPNMLDIEVCIKQRVHTPVQELFVKKRPMFVKRFRHESERSGALLLLAQRP
jgi:hypothetical protein